MSRDAASPGRQRRAHDAFPETLGASPGCRVPGRRSASHDPTPCAEMTLSQIIEERFRGRLGSRQRGDDPSFTSRLGGGDNGYSYTHRFAREMHHTARSRDAARRGRHNTRRLKAAGGARRARSTLQPRSEREPSAWAMASGRSSLPAQTSTCRGQRHHSRVPPRQSIRQSIRHHSRVPPSKSQRGAPAATRLWRRRWAAVGAASARGGPLRST